VPQAEPDGRQGRNRLANPDAPQMTPRDEQNAHLQERQRFIELMDAELQLRQTEISLMRQNGELGPWLGTMISPPPPNTAKKPNTLPTAPSLRLPYP